MDSESSFGTCERYLMQQRACKRKRGPTTDFFQVFPALLVFILLLSSKAEHGQQIPELVDDEHHESAKTEAVSMSGGSTIAPAKAMIEETSRDTINHGTKDLVESIDLERVNEELAPRERNREDVPTFSAIDQINKSKQKLDRTTLDLDTRADSDHAHSPPITVASTPSADSCITSHDCDGVDAECESCVGAEDEIDAGGRVCSSTCWRRSAGLASGSAFERKSNGSAREDESQQENKGEGDQQQQRLKGGNEGVRKLEHPEMLGSPATASVDQGQLAVHPTFDDSCHANNIHAGGSHVHVSSSSPWENWDDVATPSGQLPVITHEESRSDGTEDGAQMRNVAVSTEPVADVYGTVDYSHEHREIEHHHSAGDASIVSPARTISRAGSSAEKSPEDSRGGGCPANAATSGDRTSRDSREVHLRLETEDPHRVETPAVAISSRRGYAKEADGVDRIGAGAGGIREKGQDWRGESAKVEVGVGRGSPEELAQRVRHVESELARKLSMEEEDAKSLLDIWAERAREYVLTRTVPPTDSECDFNWTRLRCEPKCLCGSRLRFGDYTPGRSCRLLHPWERSPDCEDTWDPSDEPALRRLGAAAAGTLGAMMRAYDSRVAPSTDPECRFNLETMRCEPRAACHLRFRWGDITLSRACRLAGEAT